MCLLCRTSDYIIMIYRIFLRTFLIFGAQFVIVKLFILGAPGSGKSTACRTIHTYISQSGRMKYSTRLNDYDILREMFLAEGEETGRFEATEHGGFDVRDHYLTAVLDEALRLANAKINVWLASELEQWIMVEFSRDDYSHALRQFDLSLLQNAYFLFIEAQEVLCRERLRERVKHVRHPETSDDHYVSEHILDTYYKPAFELNILDMSDQHGIEAQRIKVIANNGPLMDFVSEIQRFVDTIL
jgi:adenylate kinase family enzyme